MSLDGFAAGADGGQSWAFGYVGPEFAACARQVLAEPGRPDANHGRTAGPRGGGASRRGAGQR